MRTLLTIVALLTLIAAILGMWSLVFGVPDWLANLVGAYPQTPGHLYKP